MLTAYTETTSSFLEAKNVLDNSPSIDEVLPLVACAARVDAPVLISGEPGAGQHLLAQVIHRASGRASRPFAIVRCGGVSDTLIDAKLFGHVRGSFSGAHSDESGVLEAANGGTVFLDEIGEATPRIQERLYQFLQSGEVSRVGADRASVRVDVRLLAGTSRDLLDDIATGSFQESLFYRLNVLHIVLPPGHGPREDVSTLLEKFLHQRDI